MYSHTVKRVLDILVALLVLTILSPLLFITSLLIKIENKGPVFYRAERIGKNKEKFLMYKFRTMSINADQTGPWFTKKNDDRITKIGLYLRKYSLDELPQLINVINGDMSLIGPRPYAPQQLEMFESTFICERHMIRPGITGLAQVSGRSGLTKEQAKKLDLIYVENCSFLMDLKVLFATIVIVLSAKEAW